MGVRWGGHTGMTMEGNNIFEGAQSGLQKSGQGALSPLLMLQGCSQLLNVITASRKLPDQLWPAQLPA